MKELLSPFRSGLPRHSRIPIRGRDTPVTICVAAVCQSVPPADGASMVIGAADRMWTAGSIEFEPEMPKIVALTSSVFVMLAGDQAMHTELLQEIFPVIQQRITAQPDSWWKVKDIADMYSRAYLQASLRRAENTYLAPLGLDKRSFMEQQRIMSPEMANQLTAQLQEFVCPNSIEAIFCGVDLVGTHIFVVKNADVKCLDAPGFAAIGTGDAHALSQFMFAKHTRARGFAETLLLVYSAKKRAEVAPGVGTATDMFTIGPTVGRSIYQLADHIMEKLHSTYQATENAMRQTQQASNKAIDDFVAEIIKKPPQPQASTEAGP